MTVNAEVLAAFDFGAPVADVSHLGAGLIHISYVVTAGDKRFVLQKINTAIFTDPQSMMENIVAVSHHLAEGLLAAGRDPGREVLTLVPTTAGGLFFTASDGGTWRVYLYQEGSIVYQIAETPALLVKAAAAFGTFASRLSDFPVDQLVETIPNFHDTRKRFDALVAAIDADVVGRVAECGPEVEFALARRADGALLMDQADSGALPLRVTHNDTKINNVLFYPDSDESCVIDLDTVMPGLIANDFGDAIRTGATTAIEDEPDLSKVSFSMPHYEAYADAYISAALGLTQAELDSLPWGARIITLEQGVRFLTDFINGDTYFGAKHPTHNLDRTRNQFKLVADMESQFDRMQAVIRTRVSG